MLELILQLCEAGVIILAIVARASESGLENFDLKGTPMSNPSGGNVILANVL